MKQQPRWILQNPLQLGDDDSKNIKELRQAIILADQHYSLDSHSYLTRFIGKYAEAEAARLQHLLLTDQTRGYLMKTLATLIERQPRPIVIKMSPEKIAETKKMLEGIKKHEWDTIIFNDPIEAVSAAFLQA